MKISPNKAIQMGDNQVVSIRKASQAEGLRNEFPVFCDCCGFAGNVSLIELLDTCPKCTPDGNSMELWVYKDDPGEGLDNTDPPHLWAHEIIKESGLSLWARVRLYLESKRPSSFDDFLVHLKKPQKFTDVFQVLYGEYRQNDHISAGYRTSAWDMLEIVAEKTFPEHEGFSGLAADLEAYASTLRDEWKEDGMDILPIDNWQEIKIACDMYLESDKGSAPAFALGLGCLVMELGHLNG